MPGARSMRARRPARPRWASSRIQLSRVWPSGTGKSGRKYLPRLSARLQRLASSTVFSSASGRSANSSAISSGDFRYCSRVYSRGRLGSSSTRPVAMQTRASCASKSSRDRKRTSLLASSGRPSSPASATAAVLKASSPSRPVRVSSRYRRSGKARASSSSCWRAASSRPPIRQRPTGLSRPAMATRPALSAYSHSGCTAT